MLIRILFLLLLCLPAYADLLTKADLSFRPQYTNIITPETISLSDVAEKAIQNSPEYAKVKEQRDDAALNISRALNSLLPEINARISSNNLDRSRPDYIEKASVNNYNARIKLRQILFSDSLMSEKTTAEYQTSAQRLAAESMRMDIIKEAVESYYGIIWTKNLINNSLYSENRLNELSKTFKTRKVSKKEINLLTNQIKSEQKTRRELQKGLKNQIEKLSKMTGLAISDTCTFQNPESRPESDTLSRLTKIFLGIRQVSTYTTIENFFTDKSISDSQELRILDELIMMKKQEVKTEKRKYTMPDVALSGEYTQYIDKGERDTEYSPDFNKNDWNVNLQLSMPIFDGKKSSPELYEKHMELMETYHRRVQIKEAVKARMQSAVAETREASENYAEKQDRVTAQTNRMAEYKQLYLKNRGNSAGMLKAVTDLNRAETELINARADLYLGLVSLQRAYGKFFSYNENYDDIRFISELEQKLLVN